MKTILFTVFVLLFSVSKTAFSVPTPTWYPYWPYSTDQGIDEVHIGYGDWCVIEEGPHPGIDFGDPDQINGSQVYSPCAYDKYGSVEGMLLWWSL